jgi:glutamate/aspartate transport system substrate-binding protein
MKTSLSIFVAMLFLFVSGGAIAENIPTLEQVKKTEVLRIGYRDNEPPMSFLNKDKQPVGYSIDLCNLVVNAVKSKLKNPNIATKYVPVTSSNRFEALTSNSIDILCGSTTKTLSRAELVDFTQLSFVTGASLLSLESANIAGVADLAGKKVAVVKDTTTIKSLEKALKKAEVDAEIVSVDSASVGMEKLIKGDVDAYSSDQIVLIGLALTNKGPEKFKVAEELFSFEPFALAVRKNDSEFRLVADRVLSELNRSGKITVIFSRWFGGYLKEVPTLLQAMYMLNSTPE